MIARLVVPFAFALAATAAVAQTASPPANTAARPAANIPAPATPTFLAKTAAGNLFEIESSKVALANSNNSEVKLFAQKMVSDHGEAGRKFKQAVSEARLQAPPDKMDAKHEALVAQLKSMKGATFDAAYVAAQREAHVETVAMFGAYVANGDNERMKKFAQEMLPTLQTHLDQVSRLR